MEMLCTRCKKRIAVLFMTRIEGENTVNEGLCVQCARELGIKPVSDLIEKMGISEEELEAMSNQLSELVENGEEGFDMGGAQPFPFLQGLFSGSESAKSSPKKDYPTAERSTAILPVEEKASESRREQRGGASTRRGEKEKQPKRKYLDAYCENLTHKAKSGQLDRIVGRDNEMYRVIQILNRRTKNNPCLIGEPGVGKTAIAEGIALKIAAGDVPARLLNKEIFLLDLTALVAGTQFRGQFESRVKGLIDEVKESGNVILFIDEVHNLVGAGESDGSMNAANILKPALSRGEVQVIGATTFNEYRKHIEKDSALERRFQPVTINEPNVEESVEVLRGIKQYYEEFHHVKVPDELVRMVTVLSERYINDRFLPDKAIDLLDEACSAANLRNTALAEYSEIKENLALLAEDLEYEQQPDKDVDYEEVARLRGEILRMEIRQKELEPQALGQEVTIDDVSRVIELWTGIPASKVRESDLKKVANLEGALKARVIGQDEAVELVAAAVKRSRVQISARRRPASFIFVGPTGVGKTELVKALSREMFDTTEPLIRLDMSEFMEKHSVSRIIGSPPGYVGYDEAGQLTEKVRRKPYSVVLFDEIEKAHPDVMNILLQILDEGRITDAHGRTVSFENTIIVMTSNAGSNTTTGSIGFNKGTHQLAKEKSIKALSDFLRPEFLGRVDETVVFRPLDKDDFAKIAALLLDELKAPMAEKGIKLGYDEKALQLLAEKSFGKKGGARDLTREIRKEVEDKICNLLIEKADAPPQVIKITAGESGIELLTIE